MIRYLSALLLAVMFGVAIQCLATSGANAKPVVDSDKAMVITGVIGRGNILPLGAELITRAAAGDKQVDLIIDSPGGEVNTGFMFINAMEAAKSRGLHIRCFVPTMAASMAFGILVHCNDRYILDKSFLLWHRAAVSFGGFGGVAMRAPELNKLAEDLAKLDALILQETVDALQIDPGVVGYHFEAQTLHTGSDLVRLAPKFATSYTSIDGLFDALINKKNAPPQNPFDMRPHHQYEYIYIYDGVSK